MNYGFKFIDSFRQKDEILSNVKMIHPVRSCDLVGSFGHRFDLLRRMQRNTFGELLSHRPDDLEVDRNECDREKNDDGFENADCDDHGITLFDYRSVDLCIGSTRWIHGTHDDATIAKRTRHCAGIR
jgi:hypothetical protein